MGIGQGNDPPDLRTGSDTSREGMIDENVHDRAQPVTNVLGTLRVMLRDVLENRFELARCRPGETQPHAPYFAQIASTSSSLAKSPRAMAASDSVSSASSSGVNW